MFHLISILLQVPSDKISKSLLRTMLFDLLTIGSGFVILLSSFADHDTNQDSATIGAALLIFGVLIRVWRRDASS